MNEFNRNFDEFENNDVTENSNVESVSENLSLNSQEINESSEQDSTIFESAAEVVEPNAVFERKPEWNEDDYQRTLVTSFVDKKGKRTKIKNPNMKRYIAVAACAAVLNMAVLGGIFAAGYHMGGC